MELEGQKADQWVWDVGGSGRGEKKPLGVMCIFYILIVVGISL